MSVVAAHPTRPRTGLLLLLVSLVVSVAAYAMVGLGLRERVPRDIVIYGLTLAGAYLLAWGVVRWTAPRADPVLLPIAGMLGGLGLAMIYRLLPADVADEQALWLLIGLAACMLTLLFVRDDRQLDAYTYTIGLFGLILLLLPVVPGIGFETNGARLWARIGPLTFQPAEFGKILVVIFLASYLSAKRELLEAGVGRLGLPRAKDLGPLLLAWGASLAVLFLERDLGASLLFFGVFIVMIWVASGRVGYLLVGGALFVAGATIGYLALSHVQARVGYWLHALEPDKVNDFGYGQLAQSWFALASGGLVGTGLGRGSPDLIPYPASDFILSAFGEELGMLGTAAILLLFIALIGRGLRVALDREDSFGRLLATGLTATIALQTFTIAAGVTRLIPLTGVPLPLVSYGGSSRVATYVMIALLVRISAGPWRPAARSAA
ncbi:MAG TPA: FtsW/RodA/SpoVE family cell cycle protein [Actinomycetota bacterium]|nr:FtsW/RodA/SpoVE family cell cycle protein [Actinomycetota bacterium]